MRLRLLLPLILFCASSAFAQWSGDYYVANCDLNQNTRAQANFFQIEIFSLIYRGATLKMSNAASGPGSERTVWMDFGSSGGPEVIHNSGKADALHVAWTFPARSNGDRPTLDFVLTPTADRSKLTGTWIGKDSDNVLQGDSIWVPSSKFFSFEAFQKHVAEKGTCSNAGQGGDLKAVADYAGAWNGAVCVISDSGATVPSFTRLTFTGYNVTRETIDSGHTDTPASSAHLNESGGLTVTFLQNNQALKFRVAFDDKDHRRLVGTAITTHPDGSRESNPVSLHRANAPLVDFAASHPNICKAP